MKVIADLDQMERIVKRRYDLVWDGYDVVRTRKHRDAVMFKDARRIKGKWFRTTVYPLTEIGWSLPDEVVE